MSVINDLGDTLTVVFNSANSYTAKLSLFPEIRNQKFFRALSNFITLVSCDFSITGYNSTNAGVLTTAKQILVGDPNIWYPVTNSFIKDTVLKIVSTPTNSQAITVTFQFVDHIPSDYLVKY